MRLPRIALGRFLAHARRRIVAPNLHMPADFPSKNFDELMTTMAAVDAKFRELNNGQPSTEWRHFAAAMNGIAYRWRALADADESFTRTILLGEPTIEERFLEEAALYAFFTNALSVIELCCYAMYAMTAQFDPLNFPHTANDAEKVKTGSIRQRFQDIYPKEPLTLTIAELLKSGMTYKTVRAVRDVLARRGSPGRQHAGVIEVGVRNRTVRLGDALRPAPSRCQGLALDATLTPGFRIAITASVRAVLEAAVPFARARVANTP